MKKSIIFLLIFSFFISSCSNVQPMENQNKINIISTIYPQYDFAKNIAGECANIEMLLSPGEESHTYEPTPKEILKINSSDLFIYTGGVSDSWLTDILNEIENVTLINLSEICEIENDEIYDEHVWTSPKNSIKIVNKITEALIQKDPENEHIYNDNSTVYLDKLYQLDEELEKTISESKRNLLVFADRFPFYHLAKDYELEYISAYSGCSEHTEPDIKTIENIINTVKEENIPTIFTIELSNEKLADVISEETGCTKSVLHSCHNVTFEEINSNVSYIDIMQNNIKVLKEALN